MYIKYILASIPLLLLFAVPAFATVGGEKTINSLTYNSQDESVYFVQNDFGGRGCPPELHKLDLNTGAVSTVFDCDAGEALYMNSDQLLEIDVVDEKIDELTAVYTPLSQINLAKNNISVGVDFIREETEYNFPSRAHFNVTVYQGGIRVAQFERQSCREDEPFLFAGYAIPGFNKKIILLSSADGDCFEGGYATEYLHIISNVDKLDKTVPAIPAKTSSPLNPSIATLSVFETTHTVPPIKNLPETPSSIPEVDMIDERESTSFFAGVSRDIWILVSTVVISIIAGLLLRRIASGRKTNGNTETDRI